MKYELVIFDLDGTILDTLGELMIAFNHALSKSGISPVTREIMRSRVGNGARNLVKKSIIDHPEADEEKILSDYREYYNLHCTENTDPYPGIPELFLDLKAHGIKIAVATNKSDAAARKLCEHCFPDTIDIVQGHVEGLPHKPDPAIINNMLKTFGISREKTLIVGDSDVDILTADNAKTDHISVGWGYKDKEVLIRNGADRIISSAQELKTIILGDRYETEDKDRY